MNEVMNPGEVYRQEQSFQYNAETEEEMPM